MFRYSGPDWTPLDELHESFPDKLLLATEATAARGNGASWWATPDWANGEYYGTFILQVEVGCVWLIFLPVLV